MTKFHIEKIDIVRGVAILLVFAYHTLLILFPNYELNKYSEKGFAKVYSMKIFFLNINPFGQGWIGVELFLVISGFLIHLIYQKNKESLDLKLFFNKRFWRIYPPYLVVFLFFFIIKTDLSKQGVKDLFFHVLMIQNLDNSTSFSINGSFWSIALECQLYLIYPIYLYMLEIWGVQKSITLILIMHLLHSSLALIYNIDSVYFGNNVFRYWFVWCSGAFLAEQYYKEKKLFDSPFFVLSISYVLVILCKFFLAGRFFILLPTTLCCLSFTEIIIYNRSIDSYYVPRKFFQIISFFGSISYSIYLIHQPFLSNLIQFYKPTVNLGYLSILLSVTFAWLTVILLAYSLYKFLEIKSINFGKKIRSEA